MTAFTWFWLYTAQSMKGILLCSYLPHNLNNRITLTNSAHVGDGKVMLRKDKHEVISTCVSVLLGAVGLLWDTLNPLM